MGRTNTLIEKEIWNFIIARLNHVQEQGRDQKK